MNELDTARTATAAQVEAGAASIGAVDDLNVAATFTPQVSPAHGSLWNDTRPRLSIAGVQITAHVDREGLLVVSIDTEAGRLQLGEDRHDIALRVLLDDVVLHEPSYAGHCWCTYRRDDDGALQLLHRAEDCGGPHPDQDTPSPALITEARAWAQDCQWKEDPEELAAMSDGQILRGVDKHYDGGLRQLARDALLDDR